MTLPALPVRPLTLASTPQHVTLDLNRTVLMAIDMQNDFCTRGDWVDHLGADFTPDRAPIAPMQRLLPARGRCAGVEGQSHSVDRRGAQLPARLTL